MTKKMLLLSSLVIMLWVIPACITEGADPKARPYDQDGVLGMTNTNPNLPTSPTHYNYKNDLELMESTLQHIEGIVSHHIVINGGKVYVQLQLSSGLDWDEIKQIEGAAYNALSFQVPRYQFMLEVEI